MGSDIQQVVGISVIENLLSNVHGFYPVGGKYLSVKQGNPCVMYYQCLLNNPILPPEYMQSFGFQTLYSVIYFKQLQMNKT